MDQEEYLFCRGGRLAFKYTSKGILACDPLFFTTDFQLKILQDSDHWFIDCKFSIMVKGKKTGRT